MPRPLPPDRDETELRSAPAEDGREAEVIDVDGVLESRAIEAEYWRFLGFPRIANRFELETAMLRIALTERDTTMLRQAPAIGDLEKTSRPSNRAGAMSPKTRAVFRAVGAVLYGENRDQLARDVRALAGLLADRSQELELAGCDDVDPDAKLTTEAVRAVLEGMSAVDDEAAPPRSKKPRS